MKDFLIYGTSLIIGATLLFFFIKLVYQSIKNDLKNEKKAELLEKKIETVKSEVLEMHKTQSNLNTQAQHVRLLNKDATFTPKN